MASPVKAIIEPTVLNWARESAGLSVDEAARKVRVTPDRLKSWESGEDRPTINQLRSLGRAYRRPIAVFYLSNPPKDFQPLRDFRRLPGVAGEVSPELRAEIRRAQYRREAALRIFEEIGEPPPRFETTARLSEDPETVGTRIRELMGVPAKQQAAWSYGYEALRGWRAAIEGTGVLVFQAGAIATDEMRGFSIAEFPLPVIVVNTKDAPAGRIFSMVHEFAHLLLRQGGLCDLETDVTRPPEQQRVEIFCNAVAGAALVPREWLLADPAVQSRDWGTRWTLQELWALSRRFGVSREVILRRLLTLERTTESMYREVREELLEEYRRTRKPTGGFAPPDVKVVANAGPSFTRLVLAGFYQERITSRDVANLLEVRLKHLPRIEKRVFGKASAFGGMA